MNKIRGFELVADQFRKTQGDIHLPTRSTKNSAGYDFYSPIDVNISPNEKVIIPTDIATYMQDDEVLMMYIRSSMGIKKGLVLSNGTAIIDADFYGNADNGGGICIAITNTSNTIVTISKGDRIAQGVFVKYLIADNGNTNTERVSGLGSTGV